MFSEDSIVLVDADSLFFKVCCVTKRNTEIRKSIRESIKGVRRDCASDNIMMAVKGRGNFRNDLASDYKANRKELDADLRVALNYAHSYMVDELGAIPADGMEADDLVSIWATEASDMGRDYVVAGIDKDLLQIVGAHYNYNKRTHQTVNKDEANLNLMLQCLTGDTADNIAGIKGIGPKKAAKILDGVPMSDRWSVVCSTWKEHKAGDPTSSWRLLKMLETWEEYEGIMNAIELKNKTTIRKQDVLHESEAEDSGVYQVSGGDPRRTPRTDRSVAVR